MKPLKIALLQIAPERTIEENRMKGAAFCKKAKAAGADLALFPEMWSNGYQIPEDIAALHQQAVPADGPFVASFGRLAKELDLAIGITFLECFQPLPRNAIA